MYNIDDMWSDRNKKKGNETPGSVVGSENATVPVQGMKGNEDVSSQQLVSTGQPAPVLPETKPAVSESVKPGVDGSDGPVTGSDVESGIAMPERQDYREHEELYRKLFESPMTPEEEQRRKRAAAAVEGIGHLGNVMNAFSNLVFTGKGAPSQKLPDVPAGELQKFEDRIAEKRRMYASGLMGARDKDLQDWKNEYLMRYNEKKAVEDRALQLMKINAEMSYKQAMLQAKNEVEERRAKERERHNRATESIARDRLQTTKAKQDKVVDSAMSSDGGIYTRNSRLTDNEAMQIVQSTGLNGLDLDDFTTGVKTDTWGNPVPGSGKIDWRAAAAYALQNGMVSGEELARRGFKRSDGSGSQGKSVSKTVAGFGSKNNGKKKVSGF